MKKMLAIISTISLGAPMGVLGTSAAVNSLTNIQDAEGDVSIDPIVPYAEDYKDHVADFGHEYKYDVTNPIGEKKDSFTSYSSNSYALNSDQKNTIMRTIDNKDLNGTQKNLSEVDHNITSFSSGSKTFVGWKGVSGATGPGPESGTETPQLAWVERDSQGKMTFRDTGISTLDNARNTFAQAFTPTEFIDSKNNDHNGIFFAKSDDSELNVNYYNLDFDKNGDNSTIDHWENSDSTSLFLKTIWNKEDLGVADKGYKGIMPIVALPEIVSNNDKLKNRILIGFIGKDSKSIDYYAYDITINEKGEIAKPIIKTMDGEPIVFQIIIKNDEAESVYSLFAPTKDGDIINKSGSGDDAQYFYGSYFFDEKLDKKLKSFTGEELVKGFMNAGVPFDNDYDVDNIMWTPGDRHIIFSVYVDENIPSISRHRFYSIDLQYAIGNHVSNVQYLFSNARNDENKNNKDFSFDGNEKAIVGRVTKPSGSGNVLDYNFIATNSTGSRTIIYKYRYDSNSSSFGKAINYNHEGDYSKNPIVETIFQIAGWRTLNDFCNLDKVMFVNNEFVEAVEAQAPTSQTVSYILEVAQKISASEMNGTLQSTTIELTQNTFDLISTAFPDLERTNKIIQTAFLDSIIKGQFTYNDSTTILGDSTHVAGDVTHKTEDINNNPKSLIGKWSTNNNNAIKIIGMSLQTVAYEVDGEIINGKSDSNLIISVSKEKLDKMLRVDTFGVSDFETEFTIKEGNKNSILNGVSKFNVISRNINNRFDLMKLNLEINNLIKKDFSDYQIVGFNTTNEIVGYVLNKINEVIYNEKLKYIGDKAISKIFSDFSINKAVSKNTRSANLHDSVHDAWRMYKAQGDNEVYNDFFDGSRPFVLTKNFDNKSDVKTPWTSEASLRDGMGWGFQEEDSIDSLNKKSNDGMSIVNLSNIVISINDDNNMSLLRSQSNMMITKDGNDGSNFDDGIMNYNNNQIELNKALLNIGDQKRETNEKGASYVGNCLTAKINTNSLEKLYVESNDPLDNSVFDASASKKLDDAVKKVKNYTINVEKSDAEAKTSIYRYFEKIKTELKLPQDIQISLWPNDNYDNFYVKPGNYDLEIVLYDALFFNEVPFFDKTNSVPINNFYQNGNYRVLNVSVRSSNNKKTNKVWIIVGSTLGSLLFLLLIGGIIWIIIYKKNKKNKKN